MKQKIGKQKFSFKSIMFQIKDFETNKNSIEEVCIIFKEKSVLNHFNIIYKNIISFY